MSLDVKRLTVTIKPGEWLEIHTDEGLVRMRVERVTSYGDFKVNIDAPAEIAIHRENAISKRFHPPTPLRVFEGIPRARDRNEP